MLDGLPQWTTSEVKMEICFDVSDKKKFLENYKAISTIKNVVISEDNVSYGMADYIVIGCNFIFEAALSGLTWDYIKEQLLPYLELLFKNKRKQDQICILISDGKNDYDIDIPSNYNAVNIEIPNKLKLELKK